MSEEVDTNYDVPSVGIYNRRGKIFIDRSAARVLTPAERREIVIHERIEHSQRIMGKSYEEAHVTTQQLFPFSPNLQAKLHQLAGFVREKTLKSPTSVRHPPDAMSAGATESDTPSSDSSPPAYDPIMEELQRRKYEKHGISSVEDMSDSDLEDIVNRRSGDTQKDMIRKRVEQVRDVGVKAIGVGEKYAFQKLDADIAGRQSATIDPTKIKAGTVVASCPSELNCTRCRRKFFQGNKVFKGVTSYYCPYDGGELKREQISPLAAFNILNPKKKE